MQARALRPARTSCMAACFGVPLGRCITAPLYRRYLAPECCRAKWYPQSDVWATGIMACYLLTGAAPGSWCFLAFSCVCGGEGEPEKSVCLLGVGGECADCSCFCALLQGRTPSWTPTPQRCPTWHARCAGTPGALLAGFQAFSVALVDAGGHGSSGCCAGHVPALGTACALAHLHVLLSSLVSASLSSIHAAAVVTMHHSLQHLLR